MAGEHNSTNETTLATVSSYLSYYISYIPFSFIVAAITGYLLVSMQRMGAFVAKGIKNLLPEQQETETPELEKSTTQEPPQSPKKIDEPPAASQPPVVPVATVNPPAPSTETPLEMPATATGREEDQSKEQQATPQQQTTPITQVPPQAPTQIVQEKSTPVKSGFFSRVLSDIATFFAAIARTILATFAAILRYPFSASEQKTDIVEEGNETSVADSQQLPPQHTALEPNGPTMTPGLQTAQAASKAAANDDTEQDTLDEKRCCNIRACFRL